MTLVPGERADRRRASLRLAALAHIYAALCLFTLFRATELQGDLRLFIYEPPGATLATQIERIEESFWLRLTPFDGQYYLDISDRGYRALSRRGQLASQPTSGNFAFFPLLPAVIRAARGLAPGYEVPVVLLLLWLASATGVHLAFLLAEHVGVSGRVVSLLLLTYPAAAFRYALYTEGLFLCLSGGSMLAALRRRPLTAGVLGALSGLCRPQGIVLCVFLFFELTLPRLRSRPLRLARAWPEVLASLAPLSGFAVLAAISLHVMGSPLAFIEIQSGWGREVSAGGVLHALAGVFHYRGPPMDLAGVAIALLGIALLVRRVPLSYLAYAVGLVLLPLSTGSILSMGRFMSVSVPHFIALGLLLECRPKILWPVLAVFTLGQFLLAQGLLSWHFVG